MTETLFIRFASQAAPPAASSTVVSSIIASNTVASDTEDSAAQTTVSNVASVEWLLADQQGGRLSTVMQGPLSEAASLASGRQVIVIVPGCEVLLAELELPAKNAAKLLQIVPFALEEQLACDIEDMHFAIGKRGANSKTPIAAVADIRMQSWLTELASAGIVANAIYPESLLLPQTPFGVTLLVEGDAIHIRSSSACSTTIEVHPFSEALQFALPTEHGTPITLYAIQDEYEVIAPALESIRDRYTDLQVKLLTEGSLPLLALQASGNELFGLQQGKYEQVQSLSSSFAGWRIAAAMALVAVLLHVAYHGTQLWRLARQERQLNEQIGVVMAQALRGNGNKDISMARTLFQSRLTLLQKGGGESALLSGLSTLSEAMAQAPGTQIENLVYANKTINLRVNAPSVDMLDQIRSRAQAGGLQAELQGAEPREKSVEGRLQLKTPGA